MKKILTRSFFHIPSCTLIDRATLIINEQNYKVISGQNTDIDLDRNFDRNLDSNDLDSNDNLEIIDLSHLYLIPAFIDSHVHLSLNGKNLESSNCQWYNPDKLKEQLIKRLEDTFSYGIGAVRDGGDIKGIGMKAKKISSENIVKGKTSFPVIIACGEGLRKKGYYGSFLGSGLSGLEQSIDEKIKSINDDNIDQIKVVLSGVVSLNEYGKVGKQQFDLEELNEIVTSADNLSLPVMAHVNSENSIKLAVSTNVHSIEHGYFISKELLEKMAAKQIYWVPTVTPIFNQIGKRFRRRKLNNNQVIVVTKVYKNQLKMIKQAVELGVKIGVGTDAGAVGVEHGLDYIQEIKLFKEAGLDNKTILQAACSWNREILGISQDKNLGFLGLNDNPLKNLEVLENPEVIIK